MGKLPEDILNCYEVLNSRHAVEILTVSYPAEYEELIGALRVFRLSRQDILSPGGNESTVPRRLSALLRPLGWYETRITGDLVVRLTTHGPETLINNLTIPNYLDGHKIDYVKNDVAFDVEWNSKDQTFDRDLYAFRAFYEANVIGVAVLLTRSQEMNRVFRELGVLHKYGASTTWMGKLEYRLKAGRGGGCPVLALGMTPRVIEDWEDDAGVR